MKIRANLDMVKSNEDLQTAILAVENMAPAAKELFFKSVAGKEFYKGIQMIAENNKPANKQFGMSWSEEEIEALNNAVRKASPEEAELLVSLLPGPVAGIIMDRLHKENKMTKDQYSDWVKVQGAEKRQDISKAVRGKNEKDTKEQALEKGARIGDVGYDSWLEKIREKRRAKKIGKVSPDAMTRPTKYGKRKQGGYKHFLRKVGKDAKIKDTQISDKGY